MSIASTSPLSPSPSGTVPSGFDDPAVEPPPRDVTSTRLTRFVLGAAGAALIAMAASAPFRDAEGSPTGRAVLPFVAGAAMGILAFAWAGSLRRAAAWLALALVGQGAAVQLVDAGTRLHYQHVLQWSQLLAERPVESGIVAAQLLLVAFGLRRRLAPLSAWTSRELGWWRAALLLGAIVLTSATVSEDVRAYLGELVSASLIQIVSLGNLVLIAWALPARAVTRIGEAANRLLGAPGDGASLGGTDRFAWTCAAIVTVVCALLSVFVYERHPHVQDEVKYLYHARYLASGMLAMRPPPVPEAFNLYLMDVGARGWYSVVPPGWPAMLAVGVKLGAGWLVNPVLSGINVLLAYLLLRAMYDLRTARVATLLLTLSPWYVFLGMGYMAHAGTLACGLLAALGVERARRTGQARYAWLGGMAIGAASLVRQLDGLVIALVLGLWAIGLGGRRLKWSATAGLVLGTAIVAAATFPYNAYFTGEAATFPIMAYHDRLFGVNVNAYGFGPDRGMGWPLDPNRGHGPIDALINSNLNTTALNVELFGWSTGSLLLCYFLILRGRLRRSDRAMLFVILATFAGYFFNYFSGGPDFGARYWFLMILPLVALSARGIEVLGGRLGDDSPAHAAGGGERPGEARVLAAAGALCLGAILVFAPWRALDKYHDYLQMRPDVRELATAHDFGRSLVLVRGREYPDYASAAIYNPVDLAAPAPVYVHDRGPAVRAAVVRAFADRPVWIIDGPTMTGGAYRVAEGPVAASTLLSSPADR